MFSILYDRMARLYAYAEVVMDFGNVLKWYPNWSFCSHHSRGSKKWINHKFNGIWRVAKVFHHGK